MSQAKLVRTDLNGVGNPDRLVLFDLSSSWAGGHCCPLAARGYSRDGKKGLPQIEYGLLTDPAGRPVAVRRGRSAARTRSGAGLSCRRGSTRGPRAGSSARRPMRRTGRTGRAGRGYQPRSGGSGPALLRWRPGVRQASPSPRRPRRWTRRPRPGPRPAWCRPTTGWWADTTLAADPVSYTHLTLPTN